MKWTLEVAATGELVEGVEAIHTSSSCGSPRTHEVTLLPRIRFPSSWDPHDESCSGQRLS